MPLGHRPPTAFETEFWKPGTGQDPAKYLVPDFNLRHARPSIASGNNVFEFPIGIEGFRRSGQALLGRHYYIGDNDVDVQVVHLDEARIELSGTFPGLTAVDNMIELTNLLASPTIEPGKILYLPGLFESIQYVNIENYDFSHDQEDRTHSINYTLSFLRTGLGRKIRDTKGSPPLTNPSPPGNSKGTSTHRQLTITSKRRTLRQVARDAYKNSNLWTRVLNLNKKKVHALAPGVPQHKLPTYRFPLGVKFYV